MYEQLKSRPDLTGLQERLLLLVNVRQKQIRLKEMQMHVLAGMNEHNSKQLQSLLDNYQRALFPGAETDEQQDEQMEKAKALLASEAKKVLVVKKYQGDEKPLQSHPQLAQLGARHATELERERMKQHRQLRNKSKNRKP